MEEKTVCHTLKEVEESCAGCQRCPLGKSRTHLVFGCGNPEAKLMFVGEAPGEQEDLSGIPFVGKAGQLLDLYLEAVGIAREEVYIANILKCRPPHNRDPLPEEENACLGFLREQVRCIRPKLLVCLGRIAANRLIHEQFAITREHGTFVKKGAFEMCAVYHPSALLRDPSKREAMLADFLAIAQKLRAI